MWQDDRVGLCMRQAECPAEHMAELVMQGHRHTAEGGTAEPGAVKRFVMSCASSGQGGSQRADALFGHQRDDRIAIDGIKRLNRMGDGVQPAGCREARRERSEQVGIIDDGFRLDPCVSPGRLAGTICLAEDVGHLRSGIAGRYHQLRQISAHCQRLAKPCRRASTESDDAICANFAEELDCCLCNGDRRMHRCERAGDAANPRRQL